MSQSRHCEIYKAVNQKWYLELGDFEYAESEDSTTYGPFESYESAYKELDNHSNPGSLCTDESGKQPVPTQSPNGNQSVALAEFPSSAGELGAAAEDIDLTFSKCAVWYRS